MNVVKSVYICIFIAVIHCPTTSKSINVTEVGSRNSTVSGVAKIDLSNGQPVNLRVQIDLPVGHNTTLKNETKSNRILRIIINSDSPLRQKSKTKDRKKTDKLLYQEMNEDGSIRLSFEMKNLDDVAHCFKEFLGAKICHGICKLTVKS